jgi:hypothetical protein
MDDDPTWRQRIAERLSGRQTTGTELTELQKQIEELKMSTNERLEAIAAKFEKGYLEIKAKVEAITTDALKAQETGEVISDEIINKLGALADALDALTPDPAVATSEPVAAEVPVEAPVAPPTE